MEKALQELVLLVRLQRIYDHIAEALRARSVPPAEVRELQELNRRRQRELEEIESQLTAHTEELRDVHRKEQEYQLELEHFQKQKAMVTNEREFTAVISEIDYATRGRDESAARRQELEAEIEQLATDKAQRREARPEEEEAHREVVTTWDRDKEELKKRVHRLAEEAHEIERALQPANRARFLRLLESKQGTAMAAVVDGSCSLCHFALRPHLQQRVRRGAEIIACETCHRILYVEDLVDEAAARD